MKNCPKCKTDNPNEAKFCRNCGSKFADIPEIVEFSIEPVCHIGDTIYITWNVENADTVMLNGIDVTSKKQSTITITDKIGLKLIARKGSIETSRVIRVNPKTSHPSLDTKLNDEECKHENTHTRIFLYALIALLCAFLLFAYTNNTDVVHHYVHTSYNNWKWIEKLLLVVLIVSCLIPSILLIKAVWEKTKK